MKLSNRIQTFTVGKQCFKNTFQNLWADKSSVSCKIITQFCFQGLYHLSLSIPAVGIPGHLVGCVPATAVQTERRKLGTVLQFSAQAVSSWGDFCTSQRYPTRHKPSGTQFV